MLCFAISEFVFETSCRKRQILRKYIRRHLSIRLLYALMSILQSATRYVKTYMFFHLYSQFIKVNHYRSRYGLQHGALAHTEQKAIKGPTNYYSVKPFKRENQRSNLYKKRETRMNYINRRQLLYIRFLI